MTAVASDRPTYTYDRLFVGGRWVTPHGSDVFEVVNPHDGTPVGRVPEATTQDVDAAVAVAREAFDSGRWSGLPLEERLAVLDRLSALLTERIPELAALITRQNGSPIAFSRRAQAGAPAAVYSITARLARGFAFEERRDGTFGPVVVRREPVGVVAAIIPWNVPAFAASLKLAPALAAGCTVILKPSPEAPLDANLLAEVSVEAGLPEGVLSVLPADRVVSEHLVGHPGIDKVSFTGSVVAGKRVMEVAAGNLSRITLELGGKSAAILLDDADLDAAVPVIAGASWALNNGQACVALTRVLVPRSRYDEVAARLVAAASALVVGDPMDPTTQVGPLVSAVQQRRNLDYVLVERGLAVARRIRTGTITVNGFATELTAPFGGYKSSGIGRELGAARRCHQRHADRRGSVGLPRRLGLSTTIEENRDECRRCDRRSRDRRAHGRPNPERRGSVGRGPGGP